MLAELCPPALIYLIFSTTQIVIDTIKGFYNTAFLKLWVTFAFTILLNFLCSRGLGIVSWIIVFIPFILMTLIISILLIMFGLDPSTGRSKVYKAISGNTPSGNTSDNKMIGGCGGTQFGCCQDGTTAARSLDDKCKTGGKMVPGVSQTRPIIIPPNGIQNIPGSLVGPDGNPQGPPNESSNMFNEKNVPTSGGGTSSNTQSAMDKEKERRAHQPTHLDGEQPSDRAGQENDRCQTFCSEECIGKCQEWDCPVCKKESYHDIPGGGEETNCGTFCRKGSPCTKQCKAWKCSNCIPDAPKNLQQICETNSPECESACSQEGADACLVDKNYLDPRRECIGWAPCMIHHNVNSVGGGTGGGGSLLGGHGGGHGGSHEGGHDMAGGVPAGSSKHASVTLGSGEVSDDKWSSGHVRGGSSGESLDNYGGGGNRAWSSHGLAGARAEDANKNPKCPRDPRPNCGCADGLTLVNGVCAHQE